MGSAHTCHDPRSLTLQQISPCSAKSFFNAIASAEDDAESERTADEPPPAYTGMTYGSLARALYEFE
eukprot:scaffold43097_cov21-Tisochrysis_lutea.AAC.1